jgi:ArsR family transcriptional regulator
MIDMKGVRFMYDIFESISYYEKKHSELGVCQCYENGMSLLKRYAAYLILKDNQFTLTKELKEEFLGVLLEDEEASNILETILSKKLHIKDQMQLIDFLYLQPDIIEEIKRIELEIPEYFEEKKKLILLKLKEPDVINSLTNLKFDSSIPLFFHVSYVNENGIDIFYLNEQGAFISVGFKVNLHVSSYFNFQDYLMIFKALGDESRLKIVHSLWQSPKNASQLAEELELTLPTITHHIKILCQAGILCPIMSTKNHKGTVYEFNLNMANKIKEALNRGLS